MSVESEWQGVVGVIGPNGAGKRTVRRILSCQLRRDTGPAQVLGRSDGDDSSGVRRQVTFLPQRVEGHVDTFTPDGATRPGTRINPSPADTVTKRGHCESATAHTEHAMTDGTAPREGKNRRRSRRSARGEQTHSSDRSRSGARDRRQGGQDSRSDRLAELHGTVGNQAVKRLHEAGDVQASKSVSRPTDRHEREAERVATAVMRQSPEEADARPIDTVHRQPGSGSVPVGNGAAEEQIDALQGGGSPLSPSVRSFFEGRFGTDFGDVRVHTGAEADQAARQIDAEAFTVGRDIAFRSRAYRPATRRGKRLLAHELTHVLQQRAGGGDGDPVDRHPDPTAGEQTEEAGPSLPSVDRVDVATGGSTHPDNHCTLCPVDLGVGVNGRALNGIELQFVLSAHSSDNEYDIQRWLWSSIWERRGGSWEQVESVDGKFDDVNEQDEYLDPKHQRHSRARLFAIDQPGFDAPLPRPEDEIFNGFDESTHTDATEIVLRFNFDEAAYGANEETSGRLDMPNPWVKWHSTTWLTRNSSNQWVLDRGNSDIGRGHTDGIDSPPPR